MASRFRKPKHKINRLGKVANRILKRRIKKFIFQLRRGNHTLIPFPKPFVAVTADVHIHSITNKFRNNDKAVCKFPWKPKLPGNS